MASRRLPFTAEQMDQDALWLEKSPGVEWSRASQLRCAEYLRHAARRERQWAKLRAWLEWQGTVYGDDDDRDNSHIVLTDPEDADEVLTEMDRLEHED